MKFIEFPEKFHLETYKLRLVCDWNMASGDFESQNFSMDMNCQWYMFWDCWNCDAVQAGNSKYNFHIFNYLIFWLLYAINILPQT